MDDESEMSRYWCHACSRVVSPILEVETIQCPLCQGGFVEEMATAAAPGNETPLGMGATTDSDRALSLWAPILLGMMGSPRRRRRFRRLEFGDDDEDDEDTESTNHHHHEETNVDRELESIIRRRRRSSATILQLLQGIRAGISTEPETLERERGIENRDSERVILINPFNQTIIVQGSRDSNNNPRNQPIGSLGDYFIGPGLELLLQHLAENDPNRYGTAPAQKEAVEALPNVKIEESLQCSVCLEDFEMGIEAKEIPCKHKFHDGCILPWLELHSSCPVCRYQLPSDESKIDPNVGSRESSNNNNGESSSNNNNNNGSGEGEGDGERNENGRRFSLPLPWPFGSLFSTTVSQSGNGNTNTSTSPVSSSSSSEPSSNAHGHPSGSEPNDN